MDDRKDNWANRFFGTLMGAMGLASDAAKQMGSALKASDVMVQPRGVLPFLVGAPKRHRGVGFGKGGRARNALKVLNGINNRRW